MIDILLDEDYTPLLAAGDFVAGLSDQQHQHLLLICNKGSFKEFPTACVGLMNYLESEDPGEMIREIKKQFTGDGMTVQTAQIINGKLSIEASYD